MHNTIHDLSKDLIQAMLVVLQAVSRLKCLQEGSEW